MKEVVFFAGCGGGYDIFGSLPILYKINQQINSDRIILLSNISFTDADILQNLSKSNPTKVIGLT